MIDSLIAGRYQILDKLGEGGSGITYQGQDLLSSKKVALKVLSLGHIDDWKKLDYFEREVNILQQLDHPQIPRYLDYFVSDNSNHSYYQITSGESFKDLLDRGIQPDQFYLVQELIEGKSFFQLVEDGWQPEEAEVKNIATQVLNILIYLQELIPPVTHRDIKPQNLIYSEHREVFLVDFGAVQDKVRQTTVGSSVVGTYGYMAPEQFRGGKSYLSSDLYGLGATLIYLLTAKHPSDLPQKRLKIDFRNQVKISSDFSKWLDKLIEPYPERRLPSAQIAKDVLQGKLPLETQVSNYLEKPSNSSLKLVKTADKLTIHIPCALNRQRWNYALGLLGIGGYVVLFLILLIISISTYNIFWKILSLMYGLLLVIQNLDFSPNKDYGWLKLVILVLMILPFIFNLNVAMIISFLILGAEIIWGTFGKNIIRQLLFDTYLTISKDKEIEIKQKFTSLLTQSSQISFSTKTLKNDFFKLLNNHEKRWLNREIEHFFDG
jgi:serine/threonine protein kinase